MLQLPTGVTICAVPTESVLQAWVMVRSFVELALMQGLGEHEPEDVFEALHSGKAQLWLATDFDKAIQGIAVTEVITYPGRKVCNLWLVAGTELNQWQGGLRHIESWALAQGCDLLQATCRPGAARKAERLGFVVMRHQVFKPLLRNQQ